MKRIVSCLLFLLLTLNGFAQDYRFSLNGKPYDATVPYGVTVLPLESDRKGDTKPGDIGQFYGYTFVVGDAGHYQFRIEDDDESKIYCKIDDKPEHCVGVKIEKVRDKEDLVLVDPLSKLTPEEKKHLRFVSLKDMPLDLDAALRDIDWSKCVLSLSENFSGNNENDALPQLPKGIQYLHLDLTDSSDGIDLSALTKLNALRFLQIYCFKPLSPSLLKGNPNIEHLIVDYTTFSAPPEFAHLTKMKFLKIRSAEGVTSADFAMTMPELRVLKIDETAVSNIENLSNPKLRLLSATGSAIKSLPAPAQVPLLRDLRILSTPASGDVDQIAAFQKALPDCVISAIWMEPLQRSLAGADRLRVRSGGTCHRYPAEEKTLFEVNGVEKVASLLGIIQLAEQQGYGRCTCCGEPSLEFYRGDELVATLGFHHGHSLRWSEGIWPGDAVMTNQSAMGLCEFLAKHGHEGPLEELNEALGRARAANRYWTAVLEFETEEFFEAWWKISEEDKSPEHKELIKHVENRWPDKTERTSKLFGLYGALPDASWSLSTGLDEMLTEILLPTVADQAGELLKSDSLTEQALQGIARWAFFDHRDDANKLEITEEGYELLAKWSLSHPRDPNHFHALFFLDKAKKHHLLLDFVTNPPKPKILAKDHENEPGGMISYVPNGAEIPEGASPRASAIWLLARAGEESARPLIEKLNKEANKPDKETYQAALKLLDQHGE